MSEHSTERALEYIRAHNTATIATLGADGPWAAAVFYASEGFDLYYLSAPDSRHSLNIHVDPRVSAAIHEDYHDWRQIKGIQMEGEARVLGDEAELARATAVYVEKYPFTARYLKLLLSPFASVVKYLDKVLERLPFAPEIGASPARFYTIAPRQLYFIDNERGLGKRREIPLRRAP